MYQRFQNYISKERGSTAQNQSAQTSTAQNIFQKYQLLNSKMSTVQNWFIRLV
jgi:hypothetical protein